MRFTKSGKVRFVSHRDVARIMERALRRIGAPLVYTEGFSPRPKLSFGLALSVGHESWGEYFDVEIDGDVDLVELPTQISSVLPDGIEVTAAASVLKSDGSLQQLVESCEWGIEIVGLSQAAVAAGLTAMFDADELVIERERKGKRAEVDVRPALKAAEVVDLTPNGGVFLVVELATAPVAIRPDEFVGLFGPEASPRSVVRRHQWMNTDGTRQEPLVPGGVEVRPGYDQADTSGPEPAGERMAS